MDGPGWGNTGATSWRRRRLKPSDLHRRMKIAKGHFATENPKGRSFIDRGSCSRGTDLASGEKNRGVISGDGEEQTKTKVPMCGTADVPASSGQSKNLAMGGLARKTGGYRLSVWLKPTRGLGLMIPIQREEKLRSGR